MRDFCRTERVFEKILHNNFRRGLFFSCQVSLDRLEYVLGYIHTHLVALADVVQPPSPTAPMAEAYYGGYDLIQAHLLFGRQLDDDFWRAYKYRVRILWLVCIRGGYDITNCNVYYRDKTLNVWETLIHYDYDEQYGDALIFLTQYTDMPDFPWHTFGKLLKPKELRRLAQLQSIDLSPYIHTASKDHIDQFGPLPRDPSNVRCPLSKLDCLFPDMWKKHRKYTMAERYARASVMSALVRAASTDRGSLLSRLPPELIDMVCSAFFLTK